MVIRKALRGQMLEVEGQGVRGTKKRAEDVPPLHLSVLFGCFVFCPVLNKLTIFVD